MNSRQRFMVEKIKLFYGDSIESFELIPEGYQNTIFKCTHRDETVYIRVIDSKRRSLQMVQAELAWLRQLYKSGISVPSLRKSNDGNQYETILLENKRYYVVAFSQVHGKQIDVNNPEIWNQHLFVKWGEILGCIHSVSPRDKIMRQSFLDPFTSVSETIDLLTIKEDGIVKERMEEVIADIKNLPRSGNSFGLIHNDFHQGNLLVNKNSLGVIDFDDCVYGWYAQDIAVSLYHAFWQTTAIGGLEKSFALFYLEYFLSGYKKTHRLTSEMIQQIPIFLRWREFFLYAVFLKNWSLDSLETWQIYTLENLRYRIKTKEPYIPLTINERTKLTETKT